MSDAEPDEEARKAVMQRYHSSDDYSDYDHGPILRESEVLTREQALIELKRREERARVHKMFPRVTSSGTEDSEEEVSAEEGAITSARIMKASIKLIEMAKKDPFPRTRSNYKKKKPVPKKSSSDSSSGNSDCAPFHDAGASNEQNIRAKCQGPGAVPGALPCNAAGKKNRPTKRRQSKFKDVGTETSTDYQHYFAIVENSGSLVKSAKEENLVPYKLVRITENISENINESKYTHLDPMKAVNVEIPSSVEFVTKLEELPKYTSDTKIINDDTIKSEKVSAEAVSQTVSISASEKTSNVTPISDNNSNTSSIVDISNKTLISASIEFPSSDKVGTDNFSEDKEVYVKSEENQTKSSKLNDKNIVPSETVGTLKIKSEKDNVAMDIHLNHLNTANVHNSLTNTDDLVTKSVQTIKPTNESKDIKEDIKTIADKTTLSGKKGKSKDVSQTVSISAIEKTSNDTATPDVNSNSKSVIDILNKNTNSSIELPTCNKVVIADKLTTDKFRKDEELSVDGKKTQPTKLNVPTNIVGGISSKVNSNKGKLMPVDPKPSKSSTFGKSGRNCNNRESENKSRSTEAFPTSNMSDKSSSTITFTSEDESSSKKSTTDTKTLQPDIDITSTLDTSDKNITHIKFLNKVESNCTIFSTTAVEKMSEPVNNPNSDASDSTTVKKLNSEYKDLEKNSTSENTVMSKDINNALDFNSEPKSEVIDIPKKQKKTKKSKKSKKGIENNQSSTNAVDDTALKVKTSSKKNRLNAKRRAAAKRKAAIDLASVNVNIANIDNATTESNLNLAGGILNTPVRASINSKTKIVTSCDASTTYESISTASGDISLVYAPGIFTNLRKLKLPTIPEISTEEVPQNDPSIITDIPSKSNEAKYDFPLSKVSNSNIVNNNSTYKYDNPVVKFVSKPKNLTPDNLSGSPPIGTVSTSSTFSGFNASSYKTTLKRKAPTDEKSKNDIFDTNRDKSITAVSGIPLSHVSKTKKTNVKRRVSSTEKNRISNNLISTKSINVSETAIVTNVDKNNANLKSYNKENMPDLLIANSHVVTDFSDIMPSIAIIDGEANIDLYKETVYDDKNITFKEVDTMIEHENFLNADIINYSATTDTLNLSLTSTSIMTDTLRELETLANCSNVTIMASKVPDESKEPYIADTNNKGMIIAENESHGPTDLTPLTSKNTSRKPLGVVHYVPSGCDNATLPTESANIRNTLCLENTTPPLQSNVSNVKGTNINKENLKSISEETVTLTTNDTESDLTPVVLKEKNENPTKHNNISVRSVSSINEGYTSEQAGNKNVDNSTAPDYAFPSTSKCVTFNNSNTSGTFDDTYSSSNAFVGKSESASEVDLLKRGKSLKKRKKGKKRTNPGQLQEDDNKGDDPPAEYNDNIDLD